MTRKHVVLLDDSGYTAYRHRDGTPFLDPAEHRVTLLAPTGSGADAAPVDRVIAADVLDRREIIRVLPILNSGPAVDHVAATAQLLQLPAATLRTELGIAGYAPQHMALFRDRTLMKQHFAAAGIRVPAHAETSGPTARAALADKCGAVMLRPSDTADPAPSLHFADPQALEQHLRANPELERRYRAEERINGMTLYAESVVRDGRPELTLAYRRLGPPTGRPGGAGRRFVQLGRGGVRAILLEFNRRALRAVSWYSGVTHLEVAVDADGLPVLLELTAHPAAGAAAAFRYVFGLDLRLAALAPQVGMAAPRRAEPDCPAGQLAGWAVVGRRGSDAVVTTSGPDEEAAAARLDVAVRALGKRDTSG